MTIKSPSCESNALLFKLTRFCKFNFVGGMGILVQLTALFLLKSVFQVNYLAATAIAVEVAVVHNFIWHEQFTWADRTKLEPVRHRAMLRLLRFNLSNGGISILGNLALMHRFVGQLQMNYLLANGIAITLCSLANFLVSETWVFEQE
jgi:putative flippase GtrA